MLTRAVSGIGNDVEGSLNSLLSTLRTVLAGGATLSSNEVAIHESLNGRIVSKKVVKTDDKGNILFEPHPTFHDVSGFTIPPFKATVTIR